MSSRGANRYNRTFIGGFINPGIGPQNWVSRSNYPVLNVVRTGPAEMSIYVNKDYAQRTAHISRYVLRLDEFVSVYAPYEGGELLTKRLTFNGTKLIINFATSAAGFLQLEILDASGQPIPGYHLTASQVMIGNETEHIVSWTEKSDLFELKVNRFNCILS